MYDVWGLRAFGQSLLTDLTFVLTDGRLTDAYLLVGTNQFDWIGYHFRTVDGLIKTI